MEHNYVRGNRLELTDKISHIPGDILLYQTRGEKIRAFIQEQIAQAEPPVVLLAHSLGGIACVDLLVQQQLSHVELLVTVGSQAPFLYEINALYSLEYGELLPEHFPEWLNIYDLVERYLLQELPEDTYQVHERIQELLRQKLEELA